ncbi:MAG: hypothetical protein ABIR96_11450 [Bdellovibrionota bacterium]
MTWVYILVRTFPFWAIPIGIGLITAAIRTKKGSKKKKFIYIFLGFTLIISSTLFLYEQGQFTAVPFVHELFHGQR